MVWDSGNKPREARNSAGAITAQYLTGGEIVSSTKYFLTGRSDSSPTEMTNSSGTLVGQQTFDLYGRPTQLQGTIVPDFGFAGYYLHAPSGLGLTRTRAYNASLGRFMSRDRLIGANLYAYVGNRPTMETDPTGMQDSWRDSAGTCCLRNPRYFGLHPLESKQLHNPNREPLGI